MNTKIYTEETYIDERLKSLGLDRARLLDVVSIGQLASLNCSPNHPPMIAGLWGWGETVRALREYLLPEGWEVSDQHNYALTTSPHGRMAIAVCAGDEGTGNPDASPSNKAPKGPSTVLAVTVNQAQMSLPFEDAPVPPPSVVNDCTTWILLVHRNQDEFRAELSIPLSIKDDGRIDGWRERIMLGSVPLDDELLEIDSPSTPDISIDVKRRA